MVLFYVLVLVFAILVEWKIKLWFLVEEKLLNVLTVHQLFERVGLHVNQEEQHDAAVHRENAKRTGR